jgi:hypothetical protein
VTEPSDLHTIEMSHGKARLIGPRPSDLGTVPTDPQASEDRDARGWFRPGNKVAVGRSARTAIRAPYRAAEKRIHEALGKGAEASDADRLLADALAVFQAVRRELGSGSALVQGPSIAYSVETILAGYYHREAAREGFLTDQGMLLHDRALACEQAAGRAMVAAFAASKALSARRPKQRNAALETIRAAGEAAEETEQ